MERIKIMVIQTIKNLFLQLCKNKNNHAQSIINNKKVIFDNYQNYGIKAVNKTYLDEEIAKFQKVLVVTKTNIPMIIVNLTSFPQRMYDMHYALYSLLKQTFPPDKVILWLSYEEFPNGLDDVPAKVRFFIRHGLEIEWTNNLKSYKKLIPALKKYPDAVHVTADDDIYYDENWLNGLYQDYIKYGNDYVYAYRAHRILRNEFGISAYNDWTKEIYASTPSFLYFPTGSGGILFPPRVLYHEVLDEKTFNEVASSADDIWYWGMAILNNKKIKIVQNFNGLVYINPERELRLNGEYTLSQDNVLGLKNDQQLQNLIRKYPIMQKLNQDFDSAIYWDERYKSGRTSGAGSYGRLAEFKAEIINNFIDENQIKSIIEFGVGDGNQLRLFKIDRYLGFDVSETVLSQTRYKFSDSKDKSFLHISKFNKQVADLVLSLDVIYHLTEDGVFIQYMNNLFMASKKFVIIYSSNKSEYHCEHVLHRKFTDWIEENKPNWILINFIKNRFQYDKQDPNGTSFADFYIYQKEMI